MPTDQDLQVSIREAGLRVTRPRVAVLGAVHDHPHLDTDALIVAARGRLGAVSHQAVYDVLRVLTERGLLRRIQPQGTVARYEARIGDNHHHLVCRSCGAIRDIDCATGEAPCLTPSAADGLADFVVDEAEVIYWGRCRDCSAAAEPAGPDSSGPDRSAPAPATTYR